MGMMMSEELKHVIIKVKSGHVGLAFTDQGLVANTVPRSTRSEALDSLKGIVGKHSTRLVEHDDDEFRDSLEQVAEYVDALWCGEKPPRVPRIKIDWRLVTVRERRILETLFKLPRDQLISYGQLAEKSGFTRYHARFVGNTMAKNPFPVLIPCHLVVKSDGTLGNYGHGLKRKEKLISTEMR